jgi:hypothetical protein
MSRRYALRCLGAVLPLSAIAACTGFQVASSTDAGTGEDAPIDASHEPIVVYPPEAGDATLGDAGHDAAEAAPPCVNLQCRVHACDAGPTVSTTISGTVMDPAGRNPLNDVVVYVPNSPNGALDPIPDGVTSSSCSCDALYSGQPMAVALTDPQGNFTIRNAPDGANVPLVVQIGKWRKEITIPSVTGCTDNPQGKLLLPGKRADGHMPSIAISTGKADSLECMLARAGIDPGEYTGDPAGAGRVHVFQDNGNNTVPPGPASATSLWDSEADLARYDIVMLSCPAMAANSPNAQPIADYVTAGGRVFAEHYHYAFFANQPQFPGVADWAPTPNGYSQDIHAVAVTTLPNGKLFPQGEALQAWLGNVGALTDAGELLIPALSAKYNGTISATDLATPWLVTDPTVTPPSAQYFSWDMPLDAGVDDAGHSAACGRVVFTDLHVSGTSSIDYQNGTVVPTDCMSGPLSPDEDALEFILFNLSSCVRPVGAGP